MKNKRKIDCGMQRKIKDRRRQQFFLYIYNFRFTLFWEDAVQRLKLKDIEQDFKADSHFFMSYYTIIIFPERRKKE